VLPEAAQTYILRLIIALNWMNSRSNYIHFVISVFFCSPPVDYCVGKMTNHGAAWKIFVTNLVIWLG